MGDGKDTMPVSILLRLQFHDTVATIYAERGQDLLDITLKKSGISEDNPTQITEEFTNAEAAAGAKFFHWDQAAPNIMVFKASPALTVAITQDRNTERQPWGCKPGFMHCGMFFRPALNRGKVLTPESDLTGQFG